jgi:hypothetical protein
MIVMRHILFMISASMLLAVFGLGAENGVHAASQQLVLIVSASTPITDISTGLLRRAFQGEAAEYAAGKRLIPINQPLNSPVRAHFDHNVLGLKPEEVGNFWVDRRIRDQSGPPRTAPSAYLALRVVMSLPGAISYISADQLNEKVRALTIDGKTAESPGYLLGE